jgi:hypothetical protein
MKIQKKKKYRKKWSLTIILYLNFRPEILKIYKRAYRTFEILIFRY